MQIDLAARHRLRLTWATLALCGALFSVHCGDPGDVTEVSPATESDTTGPPQELVSPDAWIQLSDDDDPFAALRAPDAQCGAGALTEELGGVEVDTSVCNHLSVAQPLLVDVAQGDTLRVVGWHSTLIYPGRDPVEGHITLAVGDQVVWQEVAPIPGPAAAYDATFESPVSAPAGSPVVFHVRNHGNNTWNLLTFTVKKTP